MQVSAVAVHTAVPESPKELQGQRSNSGLVGHPKVALTRFGFSRLLNLRAMGNQVVVFYKKSTFHLLPLRTEVAGSKAID